MHLSGRAAARFAVLVVVAGATTVAVSGPLAYATTEHRVLNDTRSVANGSVVRVSFPIEYFGLVADVPARTAGLSERGRESFGQARFRVDGAWTRWQVLDQDGSQARGQFTGALVSVDHADAYQVRDLPTGGTHWRAAAINTSDGPRIVTGHHTTATATAATGCRSRADWGADESLTGWSRGTDTQTFYPAQTLTVHHTAGSNDLNQDYAATVRAIYSYDIETNGWSDLAYQYLIDGNGNVYEGRSSGHTSASCLTAGGTGQDFAHQSGTDYMVTGAHVANYNAGNLGIALMGCFDSSSACSGNTTPPAASVDSLENLLASLSTRHGMNPTGTVNYVNPVNSYTKTAPTISGHRDWAATACPGGNLYAQLPTIRSNVAARMTGASAPTAPASLTATGSGSNVWLSWTMPASDGGSAVTSYQLFRSAAVPVSATGNPAWTGLATAATDTPAAGTWYYAVRACNAIGCGPTTGAGPVTTAAPPVITSGSCSAATCTFTGTGTGTLSWNFGNGSTATGGSATTKYSSGGSYLVSLTDGSGSTATRGVSCKLVKNRLRCST